MQRARHADGPALFVPLYDFSTGVKPSILALFGQEPIFDIVMGATLFNTGGKLFEYAFSILRVQSGCPAVEDIRELLLVIAQHFAHAARPPDRGGRRVPGVSRQYMAVPKPIVGLADDMFQPFLAGTQGFLDLFVVGDITGDR